MTAERDQLVADAVVRALRKAGFPITPEALAERDQQVANATVEALRKAGWLRNAPRPQVGFRPPEENP